MSLKYEPASEPLHMTHLDATRYKIYNRRLHNPFAKSDCDVLYQNYLQISPRHGFRRCPVSWISTVINFLRMNWSSL